MKPIAVQVDLFKIAAQVAAAVAWYLGEVHWLVPVLVTAYYWQYRYVYTNLAFKQEAEKLARQQAQEYAWVNPVAGNKAPRSN